MTVQQSLDERAELDSHYLGLRGRDPRGTAVEYNGDPTWLGAVSLLSCDDMARSRHSRNRKQTSSPRDDRSWKRALIQYDSLSARSLQNPFKIFALHLDDGMYTCVQYNSTRLRANPTFRNVTVGILDSSTFRVARK